MANVAEKILETFEVDRGQFRDALRAVLHTILFTRSLGTVNPKPLGFSSIPNLTVMTTGESSVDQAIETVISDLLNGAFKLIGPDLLQGDIELKFYRPRRNSSLNLLERSVLAHKISYWERWSLSIIVNNGKPYVKENVEAIVRKRLLDIYRLASDVSHVPVLDCDKSNFPLYNFELIAIKSTIDNGESDRRSWIFGDLLHKDAPSSARFSL